MDEDLRPSLRSSEAYIQQAASGAGPSPRGATKAVAHIRLSPDNPICQHAMSAFFQHAYYYHMVLYREYFLRDYKAGKGPYYSDLLFYAIATLGSLLSRDDEVRSLSDTFYEFAENILHGGVLDSPDVTTVQALLLLGQRDVSLLGRSTRWGLHSSEADVQDSVRITYPVDWDSLLNEYIEKATSRTQYEDGIAFTSCFTQLANLSKIIHRMIAEVFEYRKTDAATILAASTKSVYVALTKWLVELPPKLHWNQWLKSAVPPYVLHLHIYYHTVLILLYRPPRGLMSNHLAIFRQGFEICEQSLTFILQLLKVYSRDYGLDQLPMTFVHTAATVASLVLLKLDVPGLSSDYNSTTQQLEQISAFVEKLARTWTAASPIQGAINDAQQRIADTSTLQEPISLNCDDIMTFGWYVLFVHSVIPSLGLY
ncbi:hypothetical protein BJX62DRAFT_238774 [Aspergillus germanicus]